MFNRKNIIIASSVLLLTAFLGWAYVESTKPLPGQRLEDLGRDHVEIGKVVEYNSNPPTSGPHYVEWTKPGVYERPQDDRNLVHSLEHGYVIISYNCDFQESAKFNLIPVAKAHGIEEEPIGEASSSAETTASATLSSEFSSDQCHNLVDELIKIYEKKEKKKLVIVPRPNLDARIALTAWTYLDKFNQFDAGRIERFIDAHRDHGPEQTMEPAGE